jgi:hypothetical protein
VLRLGKRGDRVIIVEVDLAVLEVVVARRPQDLVGQHTDAVIVAHEHALDLARAQLVNGCPSSSSVVGRATPALSSILLR